MYNYKIMVVNIIINLINFTFSSIIGLAVLLFIYFFKKPLVFVKTHNSC